MGLPKGDQLLMKLPRCPPTAPPPPPRRRWSSYTKREIERFWRKKRFEEEEHFLAAIKAAARLRATSHFSDEDYMIFLQSLEEIKTKEEEVHSICLKKNCGNNEEIRVGIKDWWTKSKYAYLNQPSVPSASCPIRRSNNKPESIWFYNKPSSISNGLPKSFYFGVC
ncbi:uncharacterized protein LOC130805169 [Amaranthus tricolor]|uniref:uncharacterized protein LOC130805169 n=1 Tax=Amaranthus tricolor TaxID=29722 RepID=UPI002587430B|nr:uncharacterized protein LOC130805169 [Amaranthus tricolor]